MSIKVEMKPAEIKQARQAAGLTQTEAAKLVGVALRTWQHWEGGDRKMSAPVWKLFLLLTKQ